MKPTGDRSEDMLWSGSEEQLNLLATKILKVD
jgi:hypothetical protein